MEKFTPQLSILPDTQAQLWRHLKPFSEMGFVLYGGTAIALQLGHRVSVDFDFFSSKDLNKEVLIEKLNSIGRVNLVQDEKNTLSLILTLPNQTTPVKLSFFGNINFGRVKEPLLTSDEVLYVASLDDLMATKLKVILQRAEYKDYCDIAEMLSSGVKLDKGLSAAQLFYRPTFQASIALSALQFFNDGDLHKLNNKQKNTLIKHANSVKFLPKVEILSFNLSPENPNIENKKNNNEPSW